MEQPSAQTWQRDEHEPLALASYVAALAARRLAGRHDPLREPEGDQFAAAALFADISGFTALTERLAQTDPSGVEELMALLNGCFASWSGGRRPRRRFHEVRRHEHEHLSGDPGHRA